MKSIYKIALIAFVLNLGLNNCKKFPEGPNFSLKTMKSRISGDWDIVSYTVNGVDSMSSLPFKQITIGKFYKKKFIAQESNELIAEIRSYPDRVNIAAVRLYENIDLWFLDTININNSSSTLTIPDSSNYSGQYFLHETVTWLGTPSGNGRSNFEIIKLKENHMKIRSGFNAKQIIEYEFKKIK